MKLKPGDTIGITCPSGYVSMERVAFAKKVFERWGLKVVLGDTVGNEFNYFAGTDDQRRVDLQLMLDSTEINAIMMGRGGYGMSRIIDDLDFTAFRENPKWICGFSDITALHEHIQANWGIPTIHGPMCGHFKPETENTEYIQGIRKIMFGEQMSYITPASQYNRPGTAKGKIVGGNLSLLVHLTGSASEVNTNGKILFIEDLDEYLYHIDRMLLHLRRADKLSGLAGLIVGGFSDMKDTERPFGKNIYELILDHVKDYSYPVCFDFPAGHIDINYPIVMGAEHEMVVAIDGGKIKTI